MWGQPSQLRRLALRLLCAAAALAGCREPSLEVVGLEWERVVEVERDVRETAGAWRDQLPAEAAAVTCSSGLGRTESLFGKARSLYVPHSRRGEAVELRPVWERGPADPQWCQFERRRWAVTRTERTRGEGHTRAWPRPSLAAGEREGTRTERCTALVRGPDGRLASLELDCERWSRLAAGTRLRLRQERAGATAAGGRSRGDPGLAQQD